MRDGPPHELLLDHAQDKIAVLDEGGTFTYVNKAAQQMLGYDPAEMVGQNAFEYVHPEDRAKIEALFEKTIHATSPTETSSAYRFRAADGSWVWVESKMSNLTSSKLDGYVVSSRDVTERIEAERDRRESMMRLEELTQVSGDVFWLFSADWSELLFINAAYETVYGMPVEELEEDSTKFLETVHPDDLQSVVESMDRLSAGEAVDIEYRVNPDRNYKVWVWVKGQPIFRDGEVVRIGGFTRDITERRRRERQLYVMDNLLRHNLRNDMNVILGAAEVIEQEAPELSDRTDVIERTGQSLLTSAEKERDIIDLLVGEQTRSPVDLAEVIDRAVETVRQEFPGANIQRSHPDEATAVAVDQIGLVVVELVENAIRHCDNDQANVTVSLEPNGETIQLVVEDDCQPIPDNEANVLTGDQDMNDVYHSTGLGLWLVHWSIELSDGRLSVESCEGGGNRIRITLPCET